MHENRQTVAVAKGLDAGSMRCSSSRRRAAYARFICAVGLVNVWTAVRQRRHVRHGRDASRGVVQLINFVMRDLAVIARLVRRRRCHGPSGAGGLRFLRLEPAAEAQQNARDAVE